MIEANDLIREFESLIGAALAVPDEYRLTLSSFCLEMTARTPQPALVREAHLVASINKKLKLNAAPMNQFLSECAKFRCFFNARLKDQIAEAFDYGDADILHATLRGIELPEDFVDAHFRPLSRDQTLAALQRELRETINKRTKLPDPALTQPLLLSLLGGFAYNYFARHDVHNLFDPLENSLDYEEEYWKRLHVHAESLFERDNSLTILHDTISATKADYEELLADNFTRVSRAYDDLNNHGFLIIILEALDEGARDTQWNLCSDLILFAEKHRSVELQKGYFQYRKIAEVTSSYIGGIKQDEARFERANEGFTYRDTLVTFPDDGECGRPTLVLIFQKNERDETVLPCPACRSHRVNGNSYSSFGVKSWECQNWICPDRSMSNRGKRFSFLSLLMNKAISPENEIPVSLVRRWSRDVIYCANVAEIIEMAVSFYSLRSDSITVAETLNICPNYMGRNIVAYSPPQPEREIVARFNADPFFSRFLINKNIVASTSQSPNLGDARHKVFCGDSFDVLSHFEEFTIDGAVTSPPYYNAREYSQWDNIYCYMYDMYNNACAVFRSLKKGGFYLYNIFDYFDNENSIALSAMGKKRLILSSLTVAAFRKAGFTLQGNIVWDKGEIEGKRGFNGGNYSPYYQAPFNCWEHILIFRKPGPGNVVRFPSIIRQQPVMKFRNGVNTHGHTAPFPEAIPDILISNIPKGGVVLDPYAGSLTTGRAAEAAGRIGVSIERSYEYCKLGIAMRSGIIVPSAANS
ncbi:DNA-methyltransferase [Aliirhizobium cellulosilyticum]|uniref:DNA modification methylase n=1 Tax=Aliirhizobium cellulosilyticum TaxID=393664 RepID=A0A7W6UW31_9HYPH|nr:DNA methyltransferase [Rhizobium cellulosilyticum]MBB4347008.1 DNA modification methylase [Rhizobium cellulosilyticum]MBB4410598.1 DNA modification methylase [Rhizobium cellulosilyticum]MBB4445286.1 DNA modification methylase [Rhizobium cellulosilyticum]